jgi:hypothetical protein
MGEVSDKLFPMRIVHDLRNLRARRDCPGVVYGSVVVGGKRHIHFFRSVLGSAYDDAHGERIVVCKHEDRTVLPLDHFSRGKGFSDPVTPSKT